VVLLLLAMEAVDRRPDPVLLKTLTDMVQATIDREASAEWLTFLSDVAVVYLLGRGPSMGSAHEGALMFNEAARTPSVAMSTAQFRHGPVEMLSERFRGIVFASDHRTVDLDRALGSDLARLGGRIEVCSAPVQIAPFQPVVEIIPVQFAACKLAESKGITPGEFRYAGQVTTAETGFRG
jgi:glucosamine--fructose-6-phosphate aminotransferase (isomerizing)